MPLMGKWRKFTFGANKTFVRYFDTFTTGASVAEEEGKWKRNRENMSFSINVHASLGIDIQKEIDEWKKALNTCGYMYLGLKRTGRPMRLTGVEVSNTSILPNGKLLSASITLSFEEYIGPKNKLNDPNKSAATLRSPSWLKQEYVQNKKKKKTKKKGIEKGSVVKIIGKKYTDGTTITDKVKKNKYKVSIINNNIVKLQGLSKAVYMKDVSLC